ncbi:MAG: agmatinase family protein [Sphaerochaeta sp.]|nr:agmatinase family protein [Sphaerochaeta sp.]
MKAYFLDSEYPNTPAQSAYFHVIPFPLEKTVSYMGGTKGGPLAILEASGQLEKLVDDHTEPGVVGIHTTEAIEASESENVQEVFARAEALVKRAFFQHSIPLMLGGEHSVTNASIQAIAKHFAQGEVGILQFDAHMDLREAYEGSPFSHASVMKRAVVAGIPLFQVGVRNYSSEDLKAREDFKVGHLDGHALNALKHSKTGLSHISLPASFPKKLFITFDVDGLDASLMGSTGTPDPGGLFWWDAIDLLESLTRDRTIVGCDVVELAPNPLLHHGPYLAAKLTYHLMGLIARRNGKLLDRARL